MKRLPATLSLLTIACCPLLAPLTLAQRLMTPGSSGSFQLFPSDLAVFEAGEARKDIGCTVVCAKPVLGFDLRFHTGFDLTIPMKDLAGSENLLTILFRVTPQGEHAGQPAYFLHRVRVPEIEEGAKGDAYLQGGFDVGEGKYKVEWLMRDRGQRLCSDSWDVEAALPLKDKQVAVALPPDSIQQGEEEQFKDEPPIVRVANEPPLNIKVLVNFSPQNPRAATMQPLDTAALVSILRTIVREPRIYKFSLVAFNVHEQRVVYRQDDADRIDFPALGQALQSVSLGTTDLRRLSQKHGDSEFLSNLIRQEVKADAHPDAVVFAGPKTTIEETVSMDALKEVGELNYPVFYMNYNLSPHAVPWRDAIGNAVKFFKGQEFTITRPRDLWFAMTDMIARIVKSRNTRALSLTSHSTE